MDKNAGCRISLSEKFSLVHELWQPKIVGEMNGQYLKLAKLKGEFVWHSHVREDELFMVVTGNLTIAFRDREVELGPGELCIVPRGVEHKPVALEEVQVLMIEPKTTLNTGNVRNERTVEQPEWI